MSRTNRNRRGGGRQRNISVRAVRRDPPDLRKLSRALIQLAMAQAAAEAEAEQDQDRDQQSIVPPHEDAPDD
jgi:hypothetical protein